MVFIRDIDRFVRFASSVRRSLLGRENLHVLRLCFRRMRGRPSFLFNDDRLIGRLRVVEVDGSLSLDFPLRRMLLARGGVMAVIVGKSVLVLIVVSRCGCFVV